MPAPLFSSLYSRYSHVQILPGVFASRHRTKYTQKRNPSIKQLTPKRQCMQTVLKSTASRFCLMSELSKQYHFSAFLLKIQLQLNLTVVYLINMLQPKVNNFHRRYLMQRYIAETCKYLF